MSDRPPYPQNVLPSYLYATSKIAELKHLFPNVDDYQPNDRSQHFYLLIFKYCQTILKRSNQLATMFKSIALGLQGQGLLYDWEKEFLLKIEVDGSTGWNYLCEANFTIVVQELERCYRNRQKIIEVSKGQERISSVYKVSSIMSRIKSKLQRPTTGRRELLRQMLDAIKQEAKRHSRDREAFFRTWTSDVNQILEDNFQLDSRWLNDLEKWVRIEAGLANILSNPDFADEPVRAEPRFFSMHDVVRAMMAVPRPLSPPPGYIPPPGYDPSSDSGALPSYTEQSLANHRRLSLRQAKLRKDVPTFGFAQGGGLLI